MYSIRKNSGFTIVELLIVVVVIGILAAIVIVAYNGVQNRAYDTTVRSDLANAAKAMELYRASAGSYPATSTDLNNSQYFLKASKGSYTSGGNYNFLFCSSSPAGASYAIAAQSKSGQAYYVSTTSGGSQVFGSWGGSWTTMCPAIGQGGTGIWGYRGDTQAWDTWISQ